MNTEISFCPLCAGKLEAGEDEQFACMDCDNEFLIEVVTEADDEDEDEEDEDEDNDDEDDNENESEDDDEEY